MATRKRSRSPIVVTELTPLKITRKRPRKTRESASCSHVNTPPLLPHNKENQVSNFPHNENSEFSSKPSGVVDPKLFGNEFENDVDSDAHVELFSFEGDEIQFACSSPETKKTQVASSGLITLRRRTKEKSGFPLFFGNNSLQKKRGKRPSAVFSCDFAGDSSKKEFPTTCCSQDFLQETPSPSHHPDRLACSLESIPLESISAAKFSPQEAISDEKSAFLTSVDISAVQPKETAVDPSSRKKKSLPLPHAGAPLVPAVLTPKDSAENRLFLAPKADFSAPPNPLCRAASSVESFSGLGPPTIEGSNVEEVAGDESTITGKAVSTADLSLCVETVASVCNFNASSSSSTLLEQTDCIVRSVASSSSSSPPSLTPNETPIIMSSQLSQLEICSRSSQFELIQSNSYATRAIEKAKDVSGRRTPNSYGKESRREEAIPSVSSSLQSLHHQLIGFVGMKDGVGFFSGLTIYDKANEEVALSLKVGEFAQVLFESESSCSSELSTSIGYINAFYKNSQGSWMNCCWLTSYREFCAKYPYLEPKALEYLKRNKRIFRNLEEEDVLILEPHSATVEITTVDSVAKVFCILKDFSAEKEALDDDVVYLSPWMYDPATYGHILKPIESSVEEAAESFNSYHSVYYEGAKSYNDDVTAAINRMQLHSVPNLIPGREKEYDQIEEFLFKAVCCGSTGHILHICGVPGTGKTCTLLRAVQQLQAAKNLKIDEQDKELKCIYLNSVEIVDPQKAYGVIASELFHDDLYDHPQAYKLIDDYFKGNRPENVVNLIIIDEVEYLLDNEQSVLYSLFDWPYREGSELILVAISNTLTLSDRLISRCASRMAFGRLQFRPYSFEQIQDIIRERLGEYISLFERSAIQWCARITANYSGDIRVALNISRRAIELKDPKRKVTPKNVSDAAKYLYEPAINDAIKLLPWKTRALLAAVLAEYRVTCPEPVFLINILSRFKTFLTVNTISYNQSDNQRFLSKLVNLKILSLAMNIPVGEVEIPGSGKSLNFPCVDREAEEGNGSYTLQKLSQTSSQGNKATPSKAGKSRANLKWEVSSSVDDTGGDVEVILHLREDDLSKVLLESSRMFDKILAK